MTTQIITIWQKNTIYPPGAGVQPASGVIGGVSPPTNPGFESGSLSGWTADAGWTWSNAVFYSGAASAKFVAGSFGQLKNNNIVDVKPGQNINAQCVVHASDGQGALTIMWLDAGGVPLGGSTGEADSVDVFNGAVPVWYSMHVSGTAPNGAAKAQLLFSATTATGVMYVDDFYWDYVSPDTADPQYFTAIQTGAGTSGSDEPDWTNGGTNVGNVTDGSVTWARGIQSIITWTAFALCMTTGFEPTWGTTVGGVTPDSVFFGNKINWKCQSPIILDTACPQSKFVVIASSKVFAGDNDIVPFSATVNPQDWSTEADAGFLPTGLQTYGSNPVTAMGLYRSNLVVFNSEGFQMWQLDEDPANMALLDAMPIGSIYSKALAPVNNDLFFLSAQGVRTMGISAGSGSLSAGDVGMPVDPIIQAGIAYCKSNNVEPLAVYYPSAGQYWIVFPGWVVPSALFKRLAPEGSPYHFGESVFVYTTSRVGEVGAWSRYVFPFNIAGFCFNGDDLLIRSDDDVLKVDPAALQDYAADTYLGASRATYFPGAVQWQYLDFGQLGQSKKFDTMDIACSQSTAVTVEIGYDQSNTSTFTAPFTIPADSMPGMPLPMAIMAPSISIRLSFTSADAWQVDAVNVYVDDMRLPA